MPRFSFIKTCSGSTGVSGGKGGRHPALQLTQETMGVAVSPGFLGSSRQIADWDC